MNEPWFDSNAWAWLPGTLYGCLAGLWGTLAGLLAPQGKARPLIMGLGWLFIVSAVIFLAAAVTALATGQPYGVWYGLGLPGLLGVVLLGVLLRVVRLLYRQAEERRMQAEDLG